MQIGNLQISAEARKTILRVLSALLAVLLMFYAFYHFTTGFDSGIETMLVTEDTVETSVSGEAVVFRDEIPVGDSHTGLTLPLVAAGAHVAKDSEIVSVCAGGAEHRALYRSLSVYVEALKAAENEADMLADLADLRAELGVIALSLIDRLEGGNASEAAELAETVRVLSCRIDALTKEDFSLSELISVLEAQREALVTSSGGVTETLTAEQSGYYYPDADTHHALCSSSKIETLTGAELSTIADTLRNSGDATVGAGTLVLSPEWYVAVQVELTAEDLAALTVGGEYPIVFSDNGDARVPMTLERVIEKTAEDPAVLIFSTLRMPSGFSYDRLRTVRVVTNSETGFSVPTRAVHTLNGVEGVYVLEGSVMYFCRIEILRDLGARYLVKTTDPTPGGEYTDNTYGYIALYDAMIVSGGSLFHGRVLS